MPTAIPTRAVRIAALAAAACAVLLLVLAPGSALAFKKAVWGPLTRNGKAQFPLYHQLGAGIYEADLDWYQIAPSKPAKPTDPSDPAYRWPAALQQEIAAASRDHMQVMLQIIAAPSWANGGHSGYGWAPTDPASFAQFAQAAARKYRSVHLWMIWGEPTKAGNFQPDVPASLTTHIDAATSPAPRLYAQMLDEAYGKLKSVSRKNLVIGGNTFTTGSIYPKAWLDNLKLPNGKPPRLDMWGHNPFSDRPASFKIGPSPFGEVQFADLPRLEDWLHGVYHRRIPLFLSEFEIPTQKDDTFNFYFSPRAAATWLTDALRLARKTSWIYALGWIDVYDDLPLEAGGLLTASGTPKPDYYSFKNG